jgi:transcriptional regulator with XRE-family HTH domain
MRFGERMQLRREELGLSRAALAERLGVSPSAVSNYEKSISFPKEEIVLRLFDCLQTDPNTLFQDSYHSLQAHYSHRERKLIEQYRSLPAVGRDAVDSLIGSLLAYREELEQTRPEAEERLIPLYRSPAAAGFAAPVMGEDYDLLPVGQEVPAGAEFAVRIQGDSMTPWIADGAVVYVNRDPMRTGDVGIFCVDGAMVCKQYYRDPLGMVYLFSLNRQRADADVVFPEGSGRSLVCFGRVMMRGLPVPGKM